MTEGVCGGDPIITGRRITPNIIANYGTIEEAMEDFDLMKEQVLECHEYIKKFGWTFE